MLYRKFTIISCLFISLSAYAAIPANEDFVVLENFPGPAEDAFGIVGTNLPDGRFLLWNGDTLFLQDSTGQGEFSSIATGYSGDPGFITMAPDGHTALLGAGFSPTMYLFDTDNPVDFVPGTEIVAQTHFSGVYLSDDLVAVDRGNDDFTGSELIILDLSENKRTPAIYTVLSRPAPVQDKLDKQLILEKPDSSFPSTIKIDPTGALLYIMDANLRELRTFAVSDVLQAFNTSSMLEWETDGTPIGTPGDFFSEGVSGFTTEGFLVIAGSEGFQERGGIQFVDPTPTAIVLETLDPAGTELFYFVIYNQATHDIIAIDGSQRAGPAFAAFNPSGLDIFGCAASPFAGIPRSDAAGIIGGDLALTLVATLILLAVGRAQRVKPRPRKRQKAGASQVEIPVRVGNART